MSIHSWLHCHIVQKDKGGVLRAEMRKFEIPSDWRLEHTNQLSILTMLLSSSYLVE